MDGKSLLGENNAIYSDVTLLKSKIRERFYELGIKRRNIEESRATVIKLNLEKLELIQRAERSERQLSEANIHLQVAIQTAREAEAERSTGRELLARQGAQLEASSKEREYLQQNNRSLQVTVEEMKHELDDTKAKMKSQAHFLEHIKEKESQSRGLFDTLSSEVERLERSQTKLKQLCSTITKVTKTVVSLLEIQKHQLSEVHLENTKLHEQVSKMSGQLEEIKTEKYTNENHEKERDCVKLWQNLHQEMQNRLNENENEMCLLRTSLNNALTTSAKLQSRDLEMSSKMRILEEELKQYKEQSLIIKDNKGVQTDTIKEPSIDPECNIVIDSEFKNVDEISVNNN